MSGTKQLWAIYGTVSETEWLSSDCCCGECYDTEYPETEVSKPMVIALFTSKEKAEQYIEDSRLKNNKSQFRVKSLLSGRGHDYNQFSNLEIKLYEPPVYPIDPELE